VVVELGVHWQEAWIQSCHPSLGRGCHATKNLGLGWNLESREENL